MQIKYNYVFPSMGNIAEITPDSQIEKIRSEVDEVQAALKNRNVGEVACEVMDVIHACETMLRLMNQDVVDVAAAYCEAHNAARGYYDVPIASER